VAILSGCGGAQGSAAGHGSTASAKTDPPATTTATATAGTDPTTTSGPALKTATVKTPHGPVEVAEVRDPE